MFSISAKHHLRVTVMFGVYLGIVTTLHACKSHTRPTQNPSPSELQALYDGTYSLMLKPVKGQSNRYQFVTCLGSMKNLDTSSCTPSLVSAENAPVEYAFVNKAEVTLKELEMIDNLKQELAKEYIQEHGNFASDLSIVTMGAMVGAVAEGASHRNITDKIDNLLADGKVLEAKKIYAARAMVYPNLDIPGKNYAKRFQTPQIETSLLIQGKKAWKKLIEEAFSLINAGKNPSIHLQTMETFLQQLQFRSSHHGALWKWGQNALRNELRPLQADPIQTTATIHIALEDTAKYQQAKAKAQAIKDLAKNGRYEDARKMWLYDHPDGWMLSDADGLLHNRDIAPHRYNPKRLSLLQQEFTELHKKGTTFLDKGDDMATVLRRMQNVQTQLLDFSLSDKWSPQTLNDIYTSLAKHQTTALSSPKSSLLNLMIKKHHTTAESLGKSGSVNTTNVNAASNQGTSSISKLSRGGKMISAKPGKLAGQGVPFLGWAVGLAAGVGVIVAIVQSANSKTLTDLHSLSSQSSPNDLIASQIATNVPFVPVSLYGDYWPSLNTLDPQVNLAVPSVPSVVKTLALHASLGNVSLASEMQMCLPKAPAPQEIHTKECTKIANDSFL